MQANISENKRIEYSASEAYVSLSELTMLEENEKIELTLSDRSGTKEPSTAISGERKMPHFYELKIRVRKYDFL